MSSRTLPEVAVERGALASASVLDGVDVLAVPVAPAVEGETELQPRAGTADAAALYGVDLAEVAERAGATGAAGDTWTLHLPRRLLASASAFPWESLPERLVLVGVGSGSPTDLRRAGAALARATRGVGRVVTTLGSDRGPHGVDGARALVEGYLLGSYRIPTLATGTPAPAPAERLVLLGRHADGVDAAVAAAVVAARATWRVRDLANTPSSIKNPAWLAAQAVELAAEHDLDVRVLEPEALAEQGFGGILAVGSGSASGPRLVTVTYTPAGGRAGRHVVVVGKGITFDTGGLSIKPREPMVPMKTDMAGAAVALATVLAAAEAGVGHRVTAVLPLAENHVGAASYRPGDVLTLRGGRTVEVANTDAEGRLVLADAMAYADAELDPDVLIDVATLTGAATIGLGQQHAALYCADPDLLAGLEAAGGATGERVWHMPLVEEYVGAVRSDVADLRHVPATPPGGGSITAALFLREFAGSRRWAHLDIAGPARSTKDRHEVTEGATGFGARLLLEYLTRLA